ICQVRGPAPPLPRQVRDFYDLPPRPASEAELDSLRREVQRILQVGREDGLRSAVETWEREHRVTPDAVLPTMDRYLGLARRDAGPSRRNTRTVDLRHLRVHAGLSEHREAERRLAVDLARPPRHGGPRSVPGPSRAPGDAGVGVPPRRFPAGGRRLPRRVPD